MLSKSLAILYFTAVTGMAFASDQQSHATVFSIKPLAMIYSALVAKPVDSKHILYPDDLNIHDYQLAISDIKKLLQAKQLYWLGGSNEEHLAGLLPRFKQLKASPLAKDSKEHAWLNPNKLPDIIDTMARQLMTQMPNKAVTIQQNSQQLKLVLEALFLQYLQRLSPYAQTPILIGHSAFTELLHYVKLENNISYNHGHSHGGHAMGTKAKLAVQEMIHQGAIYCAIEEPDVSFVMLKQRFTQLHAIQLEPMATSWPINSTAFVNFMQQTLTNIEACLMADNTVTQDVH